MYHDRFLTGTVTVPDGWHIDVTQTRTEIYPRPASLPRVRPATIEQDLVRRDFSINAIAVELNPRSFGRPVDPCRGRVDLARRLIRVLHPRSFADDPTRIYRAIRLAVRLGFEIEADTLCRLRGAVAERMPARLSPERQLQELRLICREPDVLMMVEALDHEGILAAGFSPAPPRRCLPSLRRLVVGHAQPELLFVFLLTVLPIDRTFPITREQRDAATALRDFTRVRSRLARARRDSTVFRLLHSVPEPALSILALIETSAIAVKVRRFRDRLAGTRTQVTGRQLHALGLKPGPAYRRVLDRLLDARLDRRVTSEAEELALARRLVRRNR